MTTVTDATTIQLCDIRTDGGTQPRAAINQDKVDEYAEAMQRGDKFPDVEIFYDGEHYWLADGFHRYRAAQQGEYDSIAANVRQGTRRDAILFSAGVNATHGLPRTDDDKRRAVLALLTDQEWVNWSDREIARRCAVSNTFVGTVRASLSTTDSDGDDTRTYITKHGAPATMKTGGIRKAAQKRHEANASQTQGLKDPDREAVIDAAVATVRDALVTHRQQYARNNIVSIGWLKKHTGLSAQALQPACDRLSELSELGKRLSSGLWQRDPAGHDASESATDSDAAGEGTGDLDIVIASIPGAAALDADLDRLATDQDGPDQEHIELVLTILEAGPQPFKLLWNDSNLPILKVQTVLNHLLSEGAVLSKAGRYALAEHADRLEQPAPDDAPGPDAPSPGEAIRPAILQVLGKWAKDRIEFPDLRREIGRITGHNYDVKFMTGVLDQMIEAEQIVKLNGWNYALPDNPPDDVEPDPDTWQPTEDDFKLVRAAIRHAMVHNPDSEYVVCGAICQRTDFKAWQVVRICTRMVEDGLLVDCGTSKWAPAPRATESESPDSADLFSPDVDAMTPHIEAVRVAIAAHRQQQPTNNIVFVEWLKEQIGLDDRLVNAACQALYDLDPQEIVGLGDGLHIIPLVDPHAAPDPARPIVPPRPRRIDEQERVESSALTVALKHRHQQSRALYALLDYMPNLMMVKSIKTWEALSASDLKDTRELYATVRGALSALDARLVDLDARIVEFLEAKEDAEKE